MDNFKKRLTVELGIASIVIVAFLAGVFFFKGNVDDYVTRITEARILLASRTQETSDLALLRRQSATAETDLNALYNLVPTYDSLINLNADLQALAAPRKLGYGFSFAGQTQPSNGTLGSLGYNLTVTSANLNDLLSFLKSLTNFSDLSSISNASLHTSGGQLNLVVNGQVYYR